MASLVFNHSAYYAVFSISGKKMWKKIGKVEKKVAKQILKKLETEFEQEKVGLREIKAIAFSELAPLYLEYSKANKAYNSWQRDITSLKALSSYFGNILLRAIGSQEIELYKSKRRNDGVKPRTINIELVCISNVLRKAVEWNYLNQMPKIKLLKQEKKPPRFLSQEEMQKLLDSASAWLKPMLLVLRNTGLRTCELVNLKWEDVDFTRNLLTVRNQKGNSYHSMPMNEELTTTLLFLKENYITPQGKILPREESQKEYVFCFPDGRSIHKFKTCFRKAVKKAGLKGVTPHTLRHSFASHLVMSGADLPTIQFLLGHKDISTTMIYAHLSSQHIAKAVEKLPWLQTQPRLTVVK